MDVKITIILALAVVSAQAKCKGVESKCKAEVPGDEVSLMQIKVQPGREACDKDCATKASCAVWDKYCEWKGKQNPSGFSDADSGLKVPESKWTTGKGVDELVKTYVTHLKTTCKSFDGNIDNDPKVPGSSKVTEIMTYWFGDRDFQCMKDLKLWFGKTPSIDSTINTKFGTAHDAAIGGKLWEWACKGGESLTALIVLLDQFSRNLGRYGRGTGTTGGTAANVAMYSGDAMTQGIVLWALANGKYAELTPSQQQFMNLVLTHSENLWMQQLCLELTYKIVKSGKYKDGDCSKGDLGGDISFKGTWEGIAYKHFFVVSYFGRQPHRGTYAPVTYYNASAATRSDGGWLIEGAKGTREINKGKWVKPGDPQPENHGSETPPGWALTVAGCPDKTGENAFKSALPFQFNDAGLPPAGKGVVYDSTCGKR